MSKAKSRVTYHNTVFMDNNANGYFKEHKEVDALIFDLDGVITKTRETHKKAWRQLFDLYFAERKGDAQPEMSEQDYEVYIDGKPRYQGVESFLKSRDISLTFGDIGDAPGTGSICALGNLKNKLLHDILDGEGVEVYRDATSKLIRWREEGYKTAIVSSSKNCLTVLQAAGLTHLFDVRVDGLVAEELGLRGKPDPDIFIEAAKRLKVDPSHSVIFEDAASGVQAGQSGFFGLVVGVDRFGNAGALLDHGADVVVSDFSEFDLKSKEILEAYFSWQGETVFPKNKTLFARLAQKKPVIFLDYDGTLTPIVKRPEDAVLSDDMKKTLQRLARIFTVAIVTGRDKEDVQSLIGLEELVYAGSHGYIISGPGGLFMEHEDAETILPRLDKIEREAATMLKKMTQGTYLDRKRYSVGVHFRNARPEDENIVYEIVDELLEKYPGHKMGEGKKIVEIKPDLDWHKGKAVGWIWDALFGAEQREMIPLFIGDDLTDEDAFEALKGKGIGILVGGHGRQTAAGYYLKNVFQVRLFFEELISLWSSGK